MTHCDGSLQSPRANCTTWEQKQGKAQGERKEHCKNPNTKLTKLLQDNILGYFDSAHSIYQHNLF